jgi:hypothetical protein
LHPSHSANAQASELLNPRSTSSGVKSVSAVPSRTRPWRLLAPGGEGHGVDEARLAARAVADDRDVADLPCGVLAHPVLLRAAAGRTRRVGTTAAGAGRARRRPRP